MNLTEDLFIDTGYSQCCHFEEKACGDAVAFKRIIPEERLLAVMADGLGHGVKANILALMTTTMALRFVAEDREIVHSAEIIMDALPVCRCGISAMRRSPSSIRVSADSPALWKWAIRNNRYT